MIRTTLQSVRINEEQLLKEISKQNFVIFLVFIAISLFWKALAVTLGVIMGGVISVGAYTWMGKSFEKTMGKANRRAIHKFQLVFLFRLIIIGLMLFLAIAFLKVHPVALSFGLSVVVLSILIGTLRYLKSGEF